jgi:hypothetical protein
MCRNSFTFIYMVKYPKEEDCIYLDAQFNMSEKAMSSLLYAALMAKAQLRGSYMMDYSYTRNQNSRNTAWFKVFIHPSNVETFEAHANIKLTQPQSVTLN